MRSGSPYQLTCPARLRLRVTFVSQNQPPSQLHFSFSARRFPTWFRWRKSGRRAESDSGGDGLLANPRSRPTPLSAFRTPTSESVGWLLLLFDTEKQRKKKKFSARRPKIAKGFRENFCCCFSPPKSREKEKERDKNSSPHRKKCGSRCRPRRRYNKREKTDCRRDFNPGRGATPLPRSSATRGGARCSGRHTNTPARCAAPVCGSPPVRPA